MSSAVSEVVEDLECVYNSMPCSMTVTGNLFLIAVLGVILAFAAKTIADGSDLLLEVLHPGVIGGFVIPLLGALPDALIILVSGIGDQAKEEIYVGMGTLCGSTIMLLTIAWAGGLFAGRTDIVRNKSVDKRLTRKWDVLHTGVTTMRDIRKNAVIMVVTLLPYLVIQIVSLVDLKRVMDAETKESLEDDYVMASFVITCVFFVLYSLYMVFNTTMQEQRMRQARRRLVLQQVADLFVESIRERERNLELDIEADGDDEQRSMRELGHLDDEAAMNIALLHAANSRSSAEAVDIALLADQLLNTDNLGDIYALASKWKRNAQKTVSYSLRAREDAEAAAAGIEDDAEAKAKIAAAYASSMSAIATGSTSGTDSLAKAIAEEAAAGDDGDKDGDGDGDGGDDDEAKKTKWGRVKLITKAVLLLAVGTAGAAIFSDPMVDTISRLSRVAKVPSFFISFVVTPFASNASELIASLYFCAKKSSKSVSVAMAAVYGAVTMNSTLNLGILLLLMWRADIYWAFSAEALPMIFVVTVVGVFAAIKDTFTTLHGILIFLLYPLSLGFTALLQKVGLDKNVFPQSSSSA